MPTHSVHRKTELRYKGKNPKNMGGAGSRTDRRVDKSSLNTEIGFFTEKSGCCRQIVSRRGRGHCAGLRTMRRTRENDGKGLFDSRLF